MNNIVIIYLGKRGGGTNYTVELAKSLVQSGGNVRLVISKSNEQIERFLEINTSTYLFSAAHSYIQLITRAGVLVKLCTCLVVDSWQLKKNSTWHHFTMFHVWNLPLMFLLRVCGCRIVFTVHDYIPHSGDGGWLMRSLIRMMVRLSDKIVVLNAPIADQILEENPVISQDRIIVLPLLSFVESASHARSVNASDSPLKILFFGRMSAYKGIKIFLESAILSIEKLPRLSFIIAGDGDISAYQAPIAMLGDKLEIVNRWIGEDEIEMLFSRADLCVLPYLDSTQSGVMPIAQSLGLPVVITPSEGLMHQLTIGTGVVAEDFSAEAVSQAVVALLSDGDRYKELSLNALKLSGNKNQAWRNQAKILLEFYLR
jgi:glycosyltransferase involved in cell wall biosynthesis